MRIKDNGRYEWRKDQYSEAADMLGEATKSKGIDESTAFTIDMIENLRVLADRPDLMNPELAEILSTDQVKLRIESSIEIGDD